MTWTRKTSPWKICQLQVKFFLQIKIGDLLVLHSRCFLDSPIVNDTAYHGGVDSKAEKGTLGD
jgi:hypothetical protein